MIRLLKRMTGRHVAYALALIFFIAGQVIMELTVPDYMSSITKLVNTPGTEIAQIWECGRMMLLFSVLSFVSAIIARYFSARLAASFSQHLRHEIFRKVESFSLEEMDRFSTASLIDRKSVV